MAKEAAPMVVAQIFAAKLASGGDVIRGPEISEADAVERRQAGKDIVVCGSELSVNRAIAQRIEQTANGSYKRCPPHASAGPHSLPHYQPNPRPPEGHTFYETAHRKAK